MSPRAPSALPRNAVVAATTITRHLREDPALFALLVSRRLPVAVTGRVARRILRHAAPESTSPVVLAAALVAGQDADLDRRLAVAVEAAPRPGRRARTTRRWAAEIAIAAGRVEPAEALIAAAPPGAARARTVARHQWYAGDMTGAVAQLEAAGRPAARLATRMRAELDVFSGWTPTLPERPAVAVDGRVLHVLINSLPHTGSGYAQRSHSILLAQRDHGLDPLAVTRLGYPVQVGRVLARDADVVDGITYRRLLPARLAPTGRDRLQQQAELLLDVGRRFRPSVVHGTTDFTNGIVARAVARSLGVPFVYEVRGQLADTWASTRPAEARASERYRLFQAREADLMRSADLVVTLGRAMRDPILAAGVPEDRIVLTPNAVGEAYLAPPLTPAAARERLGLPDDGPIVGTVSSLVDYEGLDDLVHAVALLAPSHPTVRLMIVGSGAAEPALRRAAEAAGIGDRAIFTGRVPRERAALYHQALDVFVVPRKDRAVTRVVTPLKPVEALASARPVVASDLPALREIVEDGVTGRLVPPEDPDALAGGLAALLADAGSRERMGAAGRDHVLTHRTWAANAAALAAAYERARGTTT
ncbi:glycosyltransferase WbuB [Tersicoccus solisilvae]|uniref:D-inositol 3-phosphate glycosyltransferase n=1 Tax=Tersicoccus solisilvae TaxID=1882339 RepID=A0ABQ1P471_9MICC|nr:glycosyltransferase [Tersicoccus solisilvae]GGC89995.1 glycosyltransferase WbuB [Tersicoccus solisilvae]